MNKNVVIASDSTCDLSPELIERYGVKIMPLTVTLGGKQYKDGIDVDPDAIYKHYEETGELPKTSAPNIAEITNFFAELTAEGSAVVYFTISSEMSSSNNNARLAANNFENVYVVDSRNLSTGNGLLVVSAAEMAAEGKAAKDIAEECKELAKRVDASFIIDDLEFLHKGGRCSSVAALGGLLLQIKPCIIVKDGKMGVGKKYRGKFTRCLGKYIEDKVGDTSNIDLKHIFVTHAGCDEEIYKDCVEKVKAFAPEAEIFLTRAGCTISSHCGRNTLGVLFIRKS